MATKKAPKKFVEKKDVKTELQLLIQTTTNSHYSLLIPCVDGNFVYVRNPISGEVKHFQTNKQEFVDYIKELSQTGLGSKLEKDFDDLINKDSKCWSKVVNVLKQNEAFKGN